MLNRLNMGRLLLTTGCLLLLNGCMMDPFNWAFKKEKPVEEVPSFVIPAEQPAPATIVQQPQPQTSKPSTAISDVEPDADSSVTQDLWQRIRDGMSLPAVSQADYQNELDWYASHQEYVHRVSERASPYLHLIVEAVEARGMPMELALLPVVESAFQPFAYSPGKASGLWQFIPGTGLRFGLQQNWWYDGRRDVSASTHAALEYLQILHDQFEGDWLLAIAAYNCGEGNVLKAIRKNRQAGKPIDFFSLSLPRETRAYVPRLLAVASIVRDPASYSISLSPIANEVQLAEVDAGSQVDLARIAELSGLSMKELYQLNPAYNRWASAPDGPHRFLVPVARQQQLQSALDAMPAEQRMQWQRHRIRQGESLSVIASRYGTSVSALQRANKLKGNRIRAGHHLLIPMASKPDAAYVLSSDARQGRSTQGSGNKHIIAVQPNDTLWDLARAWNVSVAKLCQWNGISPKDMLRPGQELVIWSDRTLPASTTASTGSAPASNEVPQQSLTYRVRSGDSLWTISQRFSVSVSDLREWNALTPGKLLQPGQKLKLLVDVTRQSGSASI